MCSLQDTESTLTFHAKLPNTESPFFQLQTNLYLFFSRCLVKYQTSISLKGRFGLGLSKVHKSRAGLCWNFHWGLFPLLHSKPKRTQFLCLLHTLPLCLVYASILRIAFVELWLWGKGGSVPAFHFDWFKLSLYFVFLGALETGISKQFYSNCRLLRIDLFGSITQLCFWPLLTSLTLLLSPKFWGIL